MSVCLCKFKEDGTKRVDSASGAPIATLALVFWFWSEIPIHRKSDITFPKRTGFGTDLLLASVNSSAGDANLTVNTVIGMTVCASMALLNTIFVEE